MGQFEDYEVEEIEEENSVITVLSVISTWFIRIGMIIAVILFIYFIITGKILDAVLFILGLAVAYFFGYFFMFCLDKFIMVND